MSRRDALQHLELLLAGGGTGGGTGAFYNGETELARDMIVGEVVLDTERPVSYQTCVHSSRRDSVRLTSLDGGDAEHTSRQINARKMEQNKYAQVLPMSMRYVPVACRLLSMQAV